MRRTLIAGVVLAAAAIVAGWAYTGRDLDATEAGQQLQADTAKLVSDLGLRGDYPFPVGNLSAYGEDCAVSDGAGRPLSKGPHRQYRFEYAARPPSGRTVTEIGKDAESALRGLGYRIVTSEIGLAEMPPPGTVIARDGDDLEITLYPHPDEGFVRLTGTSRCLPATKRGDSR
jgi:hypothetical protein